MSEQLNTPSPALTPPFALQLIAQTLLFLSDSASALAEGRPVFVDPAQTEATALARLADLPALLSETVPDERCRVALENIAFSLASTIKAQSAELERLRSQVAPAGDNAAGFLASLADRLEADATWRDGDTLAAVLGHAREGVAMNDEREGWCRLLMLAQRYLDRLNALPRHDDDAEHATN